MDKLKNIRFGRKKGSQLGLILLPLLLLQATPAAAAEGCDAKTLGGLFCAFQSSSLVKLITLVMGGAFLGGVYLFYRGILKLIKVTETQAGQETLSSALLTLAAASFLVAFPATLMIGLTTIGISGAWDYEISSKVGAPGVVEGESFLVFIANFAVNAAGPLATLVMGLAVLIGLILVASAMFNLANLNSPQSRSPEAGGIIGKFIVGICLVNIFWVMEIIGASFGLKVGDVADFKDITNQAQAYVQDIKTNGDDLTKRMENIIRLVFAALVPFGLIAFVRGLLIIKDTTDGNKQASIASGFTHLVGGVALVNAAPVTCAVMTTLTGAGALCVLN